MSWLTDLLTNPFLITAVSSWLIAQVLKTIIHAIINKKIDWKRLFGDGGMPSGHSATVTSLAVVSALAYGTASFEFAVSAVLAIVVCHDAMGVRRETGKQAEVLNELIDVYEDMTSKTLTDIELKKFVGHSPVQVAAGIILGVVNAFVMYNVIF